MDNLTPLVTDDRQLTTDNHEHSLQTGRWIRSSYQFSVIGFRLKKKVVDNLTPLVTDDRQLTTDNHEHSLQTGRWITRQVVGEIEIIEKRFQFPSNGKVYHKEIDPERYAKIPLTFQFPSNGKVYHKALLFAPVATTTAEEGEVSIPFKREGVSQAILSAHTGANLEKVSIPFKREGVSQEIQGQGEVPEMTLVSIPFKREGVSQEAQEAESPVAPDESFNSLQTGRCITSAFYSSYDLEGEGFNSLQTGRCITRVEIAELKVAAERFNSLQTGRCITRKKGFPWAYVWGSIVSIPFKREGVSQVAFTRKYSRPRFPSFNSLQTGRCITSWGGVDFKHLEEKFQFPSNGKVYHKQKTMRE